MNWSWLVRMVPSLAIFCGLLVSARAARAQDYSALYSREELQEAYRLYAKNLVGMWQEDLLGRLTLDERRATANVHLELPLVGQNKHPFDYYASSTTHQVFIPIISVKFFDDLVTAVTWTDRRGCEALAVSDYVGIIRYQEPSPGRRFPPPLRAFAVPNSALKDSALMDDSGKLLKSAIYFLMAHELAHILYGHRGYASITAMEAQDQEKQADAFALKVMRRISVVPMGMSVFFMAASRFELAPGDFDNVRQYESYLHETATHPLTSARLLAIATGIRTDLDSFTRGQEKPDLWRNRILSVADEIEGIGKTLEDRSIRELQRSRSRRLTLADVGSCKVAP